MNLVDLARFLGTATYGSFDVLKPTQFVAAVSQEL
jgi:hypothetical protein